MDEIKERAQQLSQLISDNSLTYIELILAKVRDAERERCAKIADEFVTTVNITTQDVGRSIAAAIREGDE